MEIFLPWQAGRAGGGAGISPAQHRAGVSPAGNRWPRCRAPVSLNPRDSQSHWYPLPEGRGFRRGFPLGFRTRLPAGLGPGHCPWGGRGGNPRRFDIRPDRSPLFGPRDRPCRRLAEHGGRGGVVVVDRLRRGPRGRSHRMARYREKARRRAVRIGTSRAELFGMAQWPAVGSPPDRWYLPV